MSDPDSIRSPEQLLAELHRLVDEAAGRVAAANPGRLRCRSGCPDCCVDGLTVFEVEAGRIRKHRADVLAGEPHAEGACALLDEAGGCRVYEHRPYVCRTQGLPLRWFEEIEPGEMAELRDICPLNEPGEPPVVELTEEQCWTIGPFEERLAALQAAVDGGELRRVALRSLFR